MDYTMEEAHHDGVHDSLKWASICSLCRNDLDRLIDNAIDETFE